MATTPQDTVEIPAEHLQALLTIAQVFADTAPNSAAAWAAIDAAAKALREAGHEVVL